VAPLRIDSLPPIEGAFYGTPIEPSVILREWQPGGSPREFPDAFVVTMAGAGSLDFASFELATLRMTARCVCRKAKCYFTSGWPGDMIANL
jgi:hypothetical protein